MKKLTVSLVLCLSVLTNAKADTFATQPNNAGGKIVLTDEVCSHNGKTYDKLNRAYNYTTAGYTGEGCWFMEDETIVVMWTDSNQKMRYPAANFTLSPKYKNKSSSNSNRYNY